MVKAALPAANHLLRRVAMDTTMIHERVGDYTLIVTLRLDGFDDSTWECVVRLIHYPTWQEWALQTQGTVFLQEYEYIDVIVPSLLSGDDWFRVTARSILDEVNRRKEQANVRKQDATHGLSFPAVTAEGWLSYSNEDNI